MADLAQGLDGLDADEPDAGMARLQEAEGPTGA